MEVTRVFEIASLREGMMHGVELFQLLLEIISIAAVIRTFLNYFLGKELEAQAEHQQEQRSEQAKAAQ